MPKIVRFHETGAAKVLKLEDLPLTEPGEGEVRLKVEAIGLPLELALHNADLTNPTTLPIRTPYRSTNRR